MTLGLMPHQALLNDINPHLINFYRWLKRGLPTNVPMRNSQKLYYSQRETFNLLLTKGQDNSPEAAQLFFYLNRTGYNGLCRFNRRGHFNVPYGRYKRINYEKPFESYRTAFAEWEFTSCDFEDLRLQPSDFIYADPPYDVEFTQYSRDGFTWEDQVRTAHWLASHPGPVVLSNQATTRIVRLYKSLGFALMDRKAPRLISCNGDRTPADEVIATKNT